MIFDRNKKKRAKKANEQKADEQANEQEADEQANEQEADEQANEQEADEQANEQEADEQANEQEADEQANEQEVDEQANEQEVDEQADEQEADEQVEEQGDEAATEQTAEPRDSSLEKTAWIPPVARHSFPALADLEATLGHPDIDPVHCQVLEMSIEGVGLKLPIDYDPDLPGDALAELRIHCPEGEWEIHATIRVDARGPKSAGRYVRYDVDFVHPGDLFAQLDESMGRYFNRRRGERAEPEESMPLTVRVAWKDDVTLTVMEDISVTGIGVRLPAGAADSLEQNDSVEVRFSLPWQSEALEGIGVVRRNERLRDLVHLGIEFDYGRSPELEARRGLIEAFVDERLAAMADVRERLRA